MKGMRSLGLAESNERHDEITHLVEWIWPLLQDRHPAAQRMVLAELTKRYLEQQPVVQRQELLDGQKLTIELLLLGRTA